MSINYVKYPRFSLYKKYDFIVRSEQVTTNLCIKTLICILEAKICYNFFFYDLGNLNHALFYTNISVNK